MILLWLTGSSTVYKPSDPVVTNHRTCFAARNSLFQNVVFVYEAGFGLRVDPCEVFWVSSPFEGQSEAYTLEPEGTFWRGGRWWRIVSGLIKRITFPSEDPGGLTTSCGHATNPVKDKTRQMDWAGSGELSISSQTSAPLLSKLLSQYCAASFSLFHWAHLFSESLTCIQLPLSSPSSPPVRLSYIFL